MSDSLTFAFPPEVADELVERVAARAAALVLAELEGRDGDPWLDVDGAARHLGCPRSRVYDLTRRGVENPLPCHRDGRRLYFRASELDDGARRWRDEPLTSTLQRRRVPRLRELARPVYGAQHPRPRTEAAHSHESDALRRLSSAARAHRREAHLR